MVGLEADSLHAAVGVGEGGIEAFTEYVVNGFVFAVVKPSKLAGVVPFTGGLEEVYAALVGFVGVVHASR